MYKSLKMPSVTQIISGASPEAPNFSNDSADYGTYVHQLLRLDLSKSSYFLDKEKFENFNLEADFNFIKSQVLNFLDKENLNIVGFEVQKAIKINGLKFKGTADIIMYGGNKLFIGDFKTNKCLTDSLINKFFLQLSAYAIMHKADNVVVFTRVLGYPLTLSGVRLKALKNNFLVLLENYYKKYSNFYKE